MNSLPLFPDHVRCETCRHWLTPVASGLRGYCDIISEDPSRDGVPFIDTDEASDCASLRPGPGFGCVLWEKKP
jgi:hypothetical protein